MFDWFKKTPQQPAQHPYFPAHAPVGAHNLVRNGMGVRTRMGVKVYTAGLYLPAHASTPDQIYMMPGPKQVRLVALRPLGGAELGNALITGIRNNLPSTESAHYVLELLPGVVSIFTSQPKVKEGDTFRIDMVPGDATVFYINDQPRGDRITAPGFIDAVLRIWLGEHPADPALKAAMLGQKA